MAKIFYIIKITLFRDQLKNFLKDLHGYADFQESMHFLDLGEFSIDLILFTVVQLNYTSTFVGKLPND